MNPNNRATNKESVLLKVPGIDCRNCAERIKESLAEADGIDSVEVTLAKKEVKVVFSPEIVKPESLIHQVESAGFDIEEVERKEPEVSLQFGSALGYLLLAVVIGMLAVAGYLGYEFYPRFDLPAAEGISLLLLAVGAGLASFFSPCAFPLLLTLLARESSRSDGDISSTRPFRFALMLSAGAALFLLLSGVVVALGGQTLFAGVTFTSVAGQTLRVVIGILLISLGFAQMGLLPSPFHAVERLVRPLLKEQSRRRREQSVAIGMFLFGFGYLLAGFG